MQQSLVRFCHPLPKTPLSQPFSVQVLCVCVCVCLSVCPSICLSVRLSICPSVCLSVSESWWITSDSYQYFVLVCIAQEVLHDVPDFEERKKLLSELKNRLEALVSPQLISSFQTRSLTDARRYVVIFKSIRRYPQLKNYYTGCHKVRQILRRLKYLSLRLLEFLQIRYVHVVSRISVKTMYSVRTVLCMQIDDYSQKYIQFMCIV